MADDPPLPPDWPDFMAKILANPAVDLPRLVLADWLEEYGKADSMAWAQMIRMHCENPELDTQCPIDGMCGEAFDRLFNCFKCRLAYKIGLPTNLLGSHIFRRGMIEELIVTPSVWFANAANVVARFPIRTVWFTEEVHLGRELRYNYVPTTRDITWELKLADSLPRRDDFVHLFRGIIPHRVWDLLSLSPPMMSLDSFVDIYGEPNPEFIRRIVSLSTDRIQSIDAVRAAWPGIEFKMGDPRPPQCWRYEPVQDGRVRGARTFPAAVAESLHRRFPDLPVFSQNPVAESASTEYGPLPCAGDYHAYAQRESFRRTVDILQTPDGPISVDATTHADMSGPTTGPGIFPILDGTDDHAH